LAQVVLCSQHLTDRAKTLFAAMVPVMTNVMLSAAFLPVGSSARCDERVTLGVDYYPEHWPLEDMQADMAAIKNDLGSDLIRIGEFMWHELEPSNGVFNFTLLDTVIDAAEDAGLEVMIGTPTATMPAWLHKAHPEVMAKGPDSPDGYAGAVASFGGRRQYSFNSEVYLEYATRIVEALADRYGQREIISFWQVDNELGHENSDLDFSDSSLAGWRAWLKEKYGDVRRLNLDWGTAFWSVTFDSFDQVPLPGWTVPGASPRPNENFRSNSNPGMLLDFRRFRRDSITSYAESQVQILRNKGVKGCITTNAPGGTWSKTLDYNDIFQTMDLVAYDNYPVWGGSLKPTIPSAVAMDLDVVRGWAPSGAGGFMVAEQLIGAQGHDVIGYTPRPKQIIAWSAQTLLHGATSLSFFRYRAAVFGQEQFCYGILDHTTPRGTGRKWDEAKELYALAREHDSLWLAPLEARVGMLYDIDNNFMFQGQPQSTAFDFANEAHRLYQPFWRNGAAIDVITAQRALTMWPTAKALLAKYRVLLLPSPMFVVDELVPVLEEFVRLGGCLWVGFRADLKEVRGQMRREPSRLAKLAGVEVLEIESLNSPTSYSVARSASAWGAPEAATATVWREGLQLLGSDAPAIALWNYTDDFFGALGFAAMTSRQLPEGGEVVYLGAGIEPEALVSAAAASLAEQGVEHAGNSGNPDVEQLLRRNTDSQVMRVAINYGSVSAVTSDGSTLAPYQIDVRLVPEAQVSEYRI